MKNNDASFGDKNFVFRFVNFLVHWQKRKPLRIYEMTYLLFSLHLDINNSTNIEVSAEGNLKENEWKSINMTF